MRLASTRLQKEGSIMSSQDVRRLGRLPRFPKDDGFHCELTRRVDAYFDAHGLSRGANAAMIVKTITLLGWFAITYVLLVFVATSVPAVIALCASLTFATAGIGFGIQHDANHGAYAKSARVNRMLGLTLDVLGASSFLWRVKHNIAHHTYTNVDGADDDMSIGILARLAPEQRHVTAHKLQHIYLWPLYGFLLLKWHFSYDFKNLARGRVAGTRFKRPRRWDLVELILGKLVFFSLAFVVPAMVHPIWVVAVCYLAISFGTSVILAVVFQLAHCIEEAGFAEADASGHMPQSWAVHQVTSTVDFAPRNRALAWYIGGLNFQVEHHLFPRICHVHYPALSAIVERVCREHGVRFNQQPTLRAALASHRRWLWRMGHPAA
jgi:linoleoyl-CoA desaturase